MTELSGQPPVKRYVGSIEYLRGWEVISQTPCHCEICDLAFDQPLYGLRRSKPDARFEVTLLNGDRVARLLHARRQSILNEPRP